VKHFHNPQMVLRTNVKTAHIQAFKRIKCLNVTGAQSR